MMRKIIVSLCFLWAIQAQADVAISDGKISIQNVTKPGLYVFCNKKQAALILDRVAFDNPGAQAGWSTQITPFTCAVFFTDHGPFTFSCSKESSGAWGQIDCSQSLLVSGFPWGGDFLTASAPAGSYWVAENIPSDDVPLVLRHKGFDV